MRRERNKRGRGGADARGSLRIIGGQWRSRRLSFTAAEGLRPTTDRMRETLFNWLAPFIAGARCADLFAGSGALGLEALSRGAAHCDFVDTSARALQEIRGHLELLGALERAELHRNTAQAYLEQARRPLDIVFIDPPFDAQLAAATCASLAEGGRLSRDARIYLEQAAGEEAPPVPPQWREIRGGTYGGVRCYLYSAGL